MLVRDVYEGRFPRLGDVFGVEVELEGIPKVGIVDRNYWREEHDGSLRHQGREFVLRDPLTLDDCKKALGSLKQSFDRNGIEPLNTNLASTHIHVNVSDLTWQQTKDYIAVLMVFEKDLALSSGLERYNNYFALGTEEADYNHIKLMGANCHISFRNVCDGIFFEDLRYGGINLASIRKYGSLELRFLGAQPNPTTVIPWLEFYKNIKDAVRNGIDWGVFEQISAGEEDAFALGFKPPFEIKHENIMQGIRNAQDICIGTTYGRLGLPDINDNF